jgi:hypothetical protein
MFLKSKQIYYEFVPLDKRVYSNFIWQIIDSCLRLSTTLLESEFLGYRSWFSEFYPVLDL